MDKLVKNFRQKATNISPENDQNCVQMIEDLRRTTEELCKIYNLPASKNIKVPTGLHPKGEEGGTASYNHLLLGILYEQTACGGEKPNGRDFGFNTNIFGISGWTAVNVKRNLQPLVEKFTNKTGTIGMGGLDGNDDLLPGIINNVKNPDIQEALWRCCNSETGEVDRDKFVKLLGEKEPLVSLHLLASKYEICQEDANEFAKKIEENHEHKGTKYQGPNTNDQYPDVTKMLALHLLCHATKDLRHFYNGRNHEIQIEKMMKGKQQQFIDTLNEKYPLQKVENITENKYIKQQNNNTFDNIFRW